MGLIQHAPFKLSCGTFIMNNNKSQSHSSSPFDQEVQERHRLPVRSKDKQGNQIMHTNPVHLRKVWC